MAHEQTSDHLAPAEQLHRVGELIKAARIGMLTSQAADGSLVSRPMGTQDVPFDGDLYFITQASTDLASEVDGKQVNVSYSTSSSWVSISGVAAIVRDEARLAELWNMWVDAYTDGGPENPDNVILQVSGDSARYWDSPSAPVQLLGVLKAKLTGERPASSDVETVDL